MIIVPSNVSAVNYKNLTLTLGSQLSTQANNTWGVSVPPDGSALYSTDNDGTASLNKWPLSNGVPGTRSVLSGTSYGTGVAAGNQYILRPNYDGTVSVVSASTFTTVRTITSAGYYYGSPAISPDSSLCIWNHPNSNTFGVWSTATGSLITQKSINGAFNGAVFNADGSKVYVLDAAGYLTGWKVSDWSNLGTALVDINYGGNQRGALAISPDGLTVYSPCNVSGWKVAATSTTTFAPQWKSQVLDSQPMSIAASPDGSRVYVGMSNAAMCAISTTGSNASLGSVSGFSNGNLYSIALTPDGGTAFVANGGVRVVT